MDQNKVWDVQNLDCAFCAASLEDELNKVEGVKQAKVNFATKQIKIDTVKAEDESYFQNIIRVAKQVEPAIKVSEPAKEKRKKRDLNVIRILGSLLLFIIAWITDTPLLFVPSYLLAGYMVLYKSWINLIHGKLFDENFLMSIATIGAFAIGQLSEAAAVMVLYMIGEYFQDKAVEKSRSSVLNALDLRSEQSRIIENDAVRLVDSEVVTVGSVIRVLAGEKIPLDGKILRGNSTLDMQSLTGESLPQTVASGTEVFSGSVNLSGVLEIQTTKAYEDSTATKILHLVEESSTHKAPTEQFITKFARYYTPAVVFLALALAVIPSLVTGMWETWIYRALVFLVVSCPCALVISVPLTYFAGIGKSATKGILIKGGNYLEALANTDTMVFDKTGTLTNGTFSIEKTWIAKDSKYDSVYLAQLASSIESHSNHPLARAFSSISSQFEPSDVTEIAGKGIMGRVDGNRVAAGNSLLFEELGVVLGNEDTDQSTIHFAVEGVHIASFYLSDTLRADAVEVLGSLRKRGIKQMIMLSGDKQKQAELIANRLNLDEVHAQLLPHQKTEHLKTIAKKYPNLAYVGDGMNDAPSLVASRVGIALGTTASDAAMESADVVILSENLDELDNLLSISKKTGIIVRQNIVLALGIKSIVLVLGAFGFASMALAVIADSGVAVLAVFNALRVLMMRLSR